MSRIIITMAILSIVFSVSAQNHSKADKLNDQGLKLYKAGSFEAAINSFSEAIEMSSSLTGKENNFATNNLAAHGPSGNYAERVFVVDPRT
ncbi:MAG: hypothetical protein ACJ72Z_02060, partial [Pyrinomonadaceae bacterium]